MIAATGSHSTCAKFLRRRGFPHWLPRGRIGLRNRRHHLKGGNGAAAIAFELFEAVGSWHGHRIVTATRRAFEELERAVRLRSSTLGRTPVRVSSSKVSLGQRHLAIADAHQPPTAMGATRRIDLFAFVPDHFNDFLRRTGSDAAIDCTAPGPAVT